MKTKNKPKLLALSILAGASLSGSATAGVVYLDMFDGDGIAVNTGTGGGLVEKSTAGGPWSDDADALLESNYNANNARGEVATINSFNLSGGFSLSVTYDIAEVSGGGGSNRAQLALVDAASLPAGYIGDTTRLNDYVNRASVENYSIGMSLTTSDSGQGFNFNDGAGTLTSLSNAQTISTGTHTVVMEVDASGNWSYSIDGAAASTGTTTFDLNRNYHFTAFAQDDTTQFNLRSVSLTTNTAAIPEPSSTALLGLGGLALILRRRK